MAVDYELLRKKAKKRDDEKQKKDSYEYSKSMYEGTKKNRNNISANTYKLYYEDYKNSVKNLEKEQKKSINDERKKQFKSVLNMINPIDSVSVSEARKNFQTAQKNKEKKRTAYDKLKEEYENINGVAQNKNSILSKMEYITDKLSGEDTNRAEHKVESADNQKKEKQSEKQYVNEAAYYEKQDNNNKLLKNADIQKLVGCAYKSKQNADIALKEYQRSKQSGQVAFGDNVQAENYSIYNKSYESAMSELKKRGYDADSLLDTYTRNMNKQETEKIAKDSAEFANKHPVISRVAYVGAQVGQVAAVPDMIKQGVSNAVSKEYKPMDTNTSAFIATNFRNAVQEKNTENLYNYVKDKSGSDTAGKVVSFLDQTGLSVADMLSIAWLPEPVTLGVMSCGAAANTAVEATERGLSANKALYTATAAGIAESFFEKFSLENFNALQATGRTGVLNTVKDMLKQSFTEGSEEAFTDIANAITDQIINGDMSDLSVKYQNYVNQGATEQQARNTVAKDFGMQVGESFLGGALSGAVVGGVGSAINKFAFNDINARELGAETKSQSDEDIKTLIDTGLSKDKKSKAYKYAEELQNKAKKSYTSNSNNSSDVFFGTDINNSGVDYSKLSDKRLGQLQVEILKEGFKENIATAVDGEKNESKINRTINKMVNGIDLNRSDVKAIISSEKAIGAINEQFGSDFTAKNITADSLADLSTKLKSGYTNYSFTYDGLNKYQQRVENAQNNVVNENVQNVPTATQNVEETLSATQQSNSPRYNVNAVVNDSNGNQTAIKIEGKHPFSVSEDKSDIKLRTSAGKVDYENVSIENNAQQILVNEIVNNDFGNAGANAVYLNFAQNKPKNFNGDIRTYVEQAKTIYELGVSKPEMSYTDFVRKNPVFIPSLQLLGDTAVNIFRAGQTDAVNYDNYVKSQRTNKKTPSLAVRHIEGEYTNVSNNDSTIDDVFIKTAKKVGVDIERHSQGKNAGNGQFVPSLAKIIVNADGSGEYNALIHELGEFGLAYNEQAYKEVRTAIRDWFVKEKGAKDFNALVDAYVDTYSKAEGSKTREEALNELTNDAVSGLFSTDEGVESFVNFLDDTKTPTQKKNILETITDFLKSIIEKIKDVIKNSNLQSAAKTAMRMEQKQAEHIRNQFLAVLDGASKNLKNGVEVENETKNSVTLGKFADVDINSDEKLDKYGIPNTANALGDYVNIQKRVISALDNENFFNQNNKNIVVNADTDIVVSITKNGIRETLSTEKRYVKLPRKIKTAKIAVIDNLPDMIRYAEVVNENEKNYHSKEGSSFLVLSHPAIVDGENYNVEIKIKKTPVDNKFYIHNMNLQNKNETVSLNAKDITSRGYNSYDLSRTDNIAKNAIKVKNDDVKYSLDIDSDGNKLTQQQAKYFKNSKVRDEDGNLLVVYHGSPNAEFTTFRTGSYFTANKEYADLYQSPSASLLSQKNSSNNPDTYKVYLNIEKPFDTRNKREREIFENEFYMKWGNGSPLTEKGLPDWVEAMDLQEFIEENEYDYDGLIIDEGAVGGYGTPVYDRGVAYVTFSANQVKNVDNSSPTNDNDIRFSRDVDYSYEELTKKPDMKITKIDDSIDYKANSISRKNIIETAINNAKKIGRVNENGNAVIYVDDIKTDIIVPKNAIKHSLDIDSDGNKLTQQQAEYFKNSKVRDENGNLLKVYHGTSENFTVFDKTKGRANMDIQGMFFSPLELDAKDYGSNVNAYYINITNPASEQMGYKALRKFQGQNNAGVKAREYLESLGYDGVNNENEEFIAFDSNQIKLADNLTPTENEDVRFSRDVNTREKDFSKALSKNEYRQFYSIIDNRETGRIVENSAVTIYENDNIDNAKIICYNGNELKLEITAVYRLLGNDETIHGENDLSAQIIAKAEKEKYTNEEIVRLLRTNIEYYGYVLEKYDTKSGRFCSLTGTSRNDSENFENPTNGNRIQQENRYVNFSRDVDYAEYSELKRENKHLKEVNELLKHQFELTNGREVSTNALLKAGRDIKKLTSTRMTGVEVKDVMKTWHTLDTSAQLYNAAYYLAEKLVENEKKQKYQPTEQEQEMLDYLKNTKIKLSDKQKSEVAYYYGSYGKYRNAARGKINITDDGILLDDLSNEMEEMFGNLISNDNSQDLPITLLDLVNTYKDRYIDNEYGYDKQEYLESLANDILSVYFKTPLYETKADKTEKRFLRTRSRYAERLEQYRKELASEKEKHEKEFSAFRHEMLGKNREYRENLRRETVQYKAEYRQKQKEKREKSMLYKSFQRSTIRLAQLAKQDKKKHIPNNMIEAVKGIVNVISFGSKLDDEIYSKLNALDRSFKSLNNNDDYELVTSVYNNYVSQRIEQLQTMIGDRKAIDLTIDELKIVDDLVRTTVQVCNNVNKLFYAERNKTIESSVSKVTEELEKFKESKKLDLGIVDSIKYGSMKPEYFFEYLGSDELLRLYRDVRKGEDTWAVTVDNSKNYADDVREKYNWKNWNRKKRYEITTAAGDKLNLNLEQLMAIFAMSNRKQTLNHIVHGGVVITDKPKSAIQMLKDKNYKWNDSLTHKLAYEDIAKVRGMLTEEQKSYVRDMVKYLSTDMAEKGNEISRQLYDVELFKEENYYPARTAKNYMHKSSTETIGAKKLINSGFTNTTIEKAKNPLLLEEFDNVWASHVDEMASYNAFALPLENFDRVYNYQSSTGDDYNSIRTLVENAYGKKATGYISDLLEDLNGGVIHEAGSDVVDKLTSMFKKNAVFASASVAIQQPSAIGRALSIIDAKYFAKTTFTNRSYEELKKYAPVAIIKEMGYFDTNMAQSTVDYLNNVDYKGKEKLSAFFKDGSFRDEVFGIAASKADEITWAHIWNACKAETKDKHPELTGEESLKKAGERFTEVITKTQVYDSVFSRSALMRSKNGAVKMATAFMAEPTTSLNMLVNATVQAKRGKFSKKKATRIIASLVIASVINSLLQSIVTAARNDDNDKTYGEKYLAELIPNFIDNANPVNQIAFVKDVVSIFQGYDVTRADMSVISDLYNSVENLNSDKLSFTEKTESLAGALGTFFGLPLKNVLRDINSVVNVVNGAKKGYKFDPAMAKETTKAGIKESLLTDSALSLFGLDFFPEKDKNQMIYESIINDDKQMYKRIADNVSNPDNYIKKGLIENDKRVATAGLDYLNGDIKSAINTAKQLESDGFDYELAFKSIKSYASEIEKAAGYKADEDIDKYNNSIDTLTSSGVKKETVEKAINNVKPNDEQDSKSSKLYNKTDLINAVNSSDKSVINTVIDSNIKTDMANGKTKVDSQKSIKSTLSSAYKDEYLSADESQRQSIQSKLELTGYFDDEDFSNWKASSYNTEAMVEAFKTNDTKTIQTYVNERVKAKVANGMTEDNAVFGLRTSITNQYKQKFINGNADERAKIITIMTKTKLYGSRTDVISYINKYWLK